MDNKKIIAALLCAQLLSSGAAYALPASIRQAGIVDGAEGEFLQAVSKSNIKTAKGAMASQLPAELVYRSTKEIKSIYAAVTGGVINEDFNLYTSADGVNYSICKNVASGETTVNGEKQTVYYAGGADPLHRYVKAELLSDKVSLKSVYINRTFPDAALTEAFGIKEEGAKIREIKQEHVELCRERYIARNLMDTTARPECLDTMTEEGCWEDLIYDGKTISAAYNHPSRLLEIAKALINPDSEIYMDKDAIAKLEKGVIAWIDKNIIFTDNWWYNSIGVPKDFGNMMLAAGHLLTPETEKKAAEYLENKIVISESSDSRSIGTNVFTVQEVRLAYALYANDLVRIRSIFDRMSGEVLMVTKYGSDQDFRNRLWNSYVKLDHLPDTREGIQVDYSFLYHGPLLLTGSYGKVFIETLTSFMAYADGTDLFPQADLEDFSNLLLEHCRWIVRGQAMDYNVMGRSIAEGGVYGTYRSAVPLYKSLDILADFDILPRQEEITEFNNKVEAGEPAVIGNRHFWKADYTAHQQKNFLLGVRISSNRTIANETVNTGNMLCDFLGDGVTYIYRDGMEYDDIFPVWDWHKIPGATTTMRDFEPVMIQHRAVPGSKTDYAGGVSDGSFGAAAMQLNRDGLTAKKAWFMFDNEFAALGTDIRNSGDAQHLTTLNQSILRSDVTVGTDTSADVLPEGANQSRKLRWVHQDETGYIFPENTAVKISVEPQKQGDRNNINWRGGYKRPEDPKPVVKDVFTLWMEHEKGSKPTDYEYIVIPGIKAEDMAEANVSEYIHTLSNTKEVQAVENTKLNILQAVFWNSKGTVTSLNGTTISADKPVLIQLSEKDGKRTLSVASFTHKADEVTVKIGEDEFKIQLPDGEYAGQSVVVEVD